MTKFDFYKLFPRLRVKRLQVYILTPFLGLFLLTTVSIISYSQAKNSKTFLSFADEIINYASEDVIMKTVDLIAKSGTSVRFGKSLIHQLKNISLENKNLISYMQETLLVNPYLDDFHLAGVNGNFLQLYRLGERATYRTDKSTLLPENCIFGLRFIDYTKVKPIEFLQYLDINNNVVASEKVEEVLYDPRQRPWFIQAMQKRGLIYTDIYVFNAPGTPGLTAADVILDRDQNVIGVFGANITIQVVSEFLKQQKIGKSGKEMILTPTGKIIAYPDQNIITSTEISEGRDFVSDLKNPVFSTAFRKFQKSGSRKFFFDSDQKTYMGFFSPFPPNFSKDWMICIVVPVNDFIGDFLEINRHVLYISAIIFVIAIFLITWLSNEISRPIIQLAKKTDKFKDLTFDTVTGLSSNIKEIKMLSDAVVGMSKALQAFGRFVPKQVVHQLIKKNYEVKVGGQRREITLLFCDVNDFSQYAESIDSEMILSQLSEYFDEMSKVILDLKGTIDKYIGDSIMAFWGAPSSDSEHSVHACLAALLCQQHQSLLNHKWKSTQLPELKTRMGIHDGEVIIGNIGTSERVNYTAIGSPVNIASRIEKANKFYGTNIILSESVYEKVRSDFLCRPLDTVIVKGSQLGIKIYELMAPIKNHPPLVLTPEQKRLSESFTDAFEIYHKKKWKHALELFEQIHEEFPKDLPTKIYIERCHEYIQNPPDKHWDGIIRFTTK